jgi:NAD(P)-dependent dehydrogenase (short-subunit alcohol dehydrogenase family)
LLYKSQLTPSLNQWEFLLQISADPNNTVIGIVRNKAASEKRASEEIPDRKNVHIVQGDLDDYASLQSAVAETANITGGGLDYLIANAALLVSYDAFDAIDELCIPYLSLSSLFPSPGQLKLTPNQIATKTRQASRTTS